MKRLFMNYVFNAKQGDQLVHFSAPNELLITGFKFTYVAPEKLDEELLNICRTNSVFRNNTKSDCLEEGILNSKLDNMKVTLTDREIEFYWDTVA